MGADNGFSLPHAANILIAICINFILPKTGGVYQYTDDEKLKLKNQFFIIDDDKIIRNKDSNNDYRLKIKNSLLRKFIKRFDGKAERERINNLSREFNEELIKTGIFDWSKIKYRYCGRHLTDIEFSKHFQIYELLLADIVELILTTEQENDLKKIMETPNDNYYFATVDEIKSIGINTITGNLKETISDHTVKIIQENESKLIKPKNVGEIYTVDLNIE